MHAWNYFPMLAQLLFLLSFCNTRHTASWETCPTDSNFTTNSTYHFNLNLLLPSLTSATVSTGYANTSAGRSPDQVFGLARCQLDASQDKCQACLATAVDTLRSSCPSAKDAATWEDLCFLAYSNTTFSNDRDKSSFTQIIVNGGEVSETSRFVDLVGELMNALINWAAYKTDSMFAIGQANFTSFTKVYGLVQCTRDQSDDDCFLCIRQSLALMQSCCLKNQGGVVLKYKCFLRYETYSYYNLSVATSPLPPLSSAFSSAPPPGATANPPPPPAVVDSNSSSSSARDAGKLQYIIKLSKKQTSKIAVAVVIPILGAVMLVAALLIFLWRTKIFARKSKVGGAKSEKPDSLLFDFETLKVATNNFSDANKLGEGGFGPVYKGVLSDGQEVAVKRLARSSQQGFAELRNEVAFVAKLQHRNLVRLIGFCSEEEKLLVYEFLPNTSLDKILFADPTKCGQLNWERRYKIIEGIARGLLYLHEDSRLRIIHRDLKPGNILLDQHMNPKISDFGLSKLLVDQDRSEESASRIVGTNGYIAPEYALLRHVSDKSDVYSYGVLVLEIITGRRISEFRGSGHRANLQSYAWKYWNKGKALQIVDQNLCGRFQREEALPCIRTALLCVQENPSKRPTMASVVLMLSSSSMTTLSPSAPGFLIEASGTTDSNESTGNRSPEIKNEREGSSTSINEVSITKYFAACIKWVFCRNHLLLGSLRSIRNCSVVDPRHCVLRVETKSTRLASLQSQESPFSPFDSDPSTFERTTSLHALSTASQKQRRTTSCTMHSWNYFRILAQLLFLLSLYNARHNASLARCSTDSNFTTNSTYHSNLNLLLPSLTTATVSTGSANTSAGRSPDQVFGLARCQLDVSQDICQACLATAVDTLRSSCPSAKDAATWGDRCFLAYSNATFSNDSDKLSFSQILYNVGEVSETSRFVNLVEELMNALINWASYKTDSMFAIGEANFTSFTKVYGLVQCTRDQSDDDCFLCLRQSLGSMQGCCLKNQGGVVLKYRCYLRYETYSYYNMSVATSPLPPLSSALSSAPPPGATANPPPPPAVVDSNSSSSSAIDAGKLQYIKLQTIHPYFPTNRCKFM
ncbi:unnamed protein product [Musa banksii]